jgi:Prp8 binding protein
MSAEKRPAGENLSASQLVKRQRSDANINIRTVAVVGGNAKNGALIQAVGARDDQILSR